MKILVLRFSSIGDIVLTTPVIRCLKQQTGAEVHFLTKTAYANILESNPYIDRVLGFKKEINEILPALKAEQYDLIVDLHHNIRSLRLKLALGVPARSFDKLNWQKWLLVNTGIDLLPKVHIVDRYMAAVGHLGVKNDGEGLDYFIPKEQEVNLSALAANLKPGKFVSFVIGATHTTKRLPIDKIIGICQDIENSVILLGGKTESAAGKQIFAAIGPKIVNLCGQLTLHQSASIIRQSDQVITHDTGLMHIAAAFRKEIISVWGSTVPVFGMYPYLPAGFGKNTMIQVEGLHCRPCSKIGYDKCPKGHFKCMTENNLKPQFFDK